MRYFFKNIIFEDFPKLPLYVVETYKQITEPPTCSGDQPNLLFALSLLCGQRGAIVEIGSFIGRSTIALAAAQKEKQGHKIVAIDCSVNPKLHENLERAGLNEWVEIIRGFSHNISRRWADPIELLFIDGCHRYWSVKNDLLCWTPFIIEGGCVAIHDYGLAQFPGVSKAVLKVLFSDPEKWGVVSDRNSGSLIVFRRLADSHPRKWSSYIRYYFQIWTTKLFLFLSKLIRRLLKLSLQRESEI